MMDIASIADWLKTSVAGVIVLGALGSVFASLACRLAGSLLRACNLGLCWWKKREYEHGWRNGVVACYLNISKDAVLATFFVAYCLSRALLAAVLTVSMLVAFCSLLPLSGPALQTGTFISATVFFLAARWLYEEHRNMRCIYVHEILPIVEAVAQAREERAKNA